MNCKHCGGPVQICYDGNCGGWHPPRLRYERGPSRPEPCAGWVHYDLFHGCEDGKHQALAEGVEPGYVVTAGSADPWAAEGSQS